jgi:hypothetical protein
MELSKLNQIFAVFNDEDSQGIEETMENLQKYLTGLPIDERLQATSELAYYLSLARTDQLKVFLEIMPDGGLTIHPEGVPENPERIITNFEASLRIAEIANEMLASVEN